jgi:hypothetical protein
MVGLGLSRLGERRLGNLICYLLSKFARWRRSFLGTAIKFLFVPSVLSRTENCFGTRFNACPTQLLALLLGYLLDYSAAGSVAWLITRPLSCLLCNLATYSTAGSATGSAASSLGGNLIASALCLPLLASTVISVSADLPPPVASYLAGLCARTHFQPLCFSRF